MRNCGHLFLLFLLIGLLGGRNAGVPVLPFQLSAKFVVRWNTTGPVARERDAFQRKGWGACMVAKVLKRSNWLVRPEVASVLGTSLAVYDWWPKTFTPFKHGRMPNSLKSGYDGYPGRCVRYARFHPFSTHANLKGKKRTRRGNTFFSFTPLSTPDRAVVP